MADAASKKKILLVDDSELTLRIGKTALSALYAVYTKPSAELMFSFLAKNSVDLILLDIEMPETDGFTAIERLKANPDTAGIPVIFLSGNTDDGSDTRGFELGAASFIMKPFTPNQLLEHVASHLCAAFKVK